MHNNNQNISIVIPVYNSEDILPVLVKRLMSSSTYKNNEIELIFVNDCSYSFHETKNYTCGEGGAIILNDEIFI